MNLSTLELLMSCSTPSFSPSHNRPKARCPSSIPRNHFRRISCSRLSVEELAAVVHNKVLVAATLGSAIGQLSKPLTKAAADGKGIDWRNAIRSGGMPSTHAASVVAAATSLGLERGFSDAIFGMSVVFAALVMYDAQGVRKEVGNHARVLNKIIALDRSCNSCLNREDVARDNTGNQNINNAEFENSKFVPLNENSAASTSTVTAKQLDTKSSLATSSTGSSEMSVLSCEPLSESVGHTRVQVFVGALLGVVTSLIIDSIL